MGRGAVGPLGQPRADYTLSHCPGGGGGGGVTVVVVVMKEGTWPVPRMRFFTA